MERLKIKYLSKSVMYYGRKSVSKRYASASLEEVQHLQIAGKSSRY
jgi:hypothetical protein